jgi:hypothetical protein
MIDRRTLFKGIAGLAGGLILPPSVAENAEAARRYWSLDRTMIVPLPDTTMITIDGLTSLRPGDLIEIVDFFPGSSTDLDFSTREKLVVANIREERGVLAVRGRRSL